MTDIQILSHVAIAILLGAVVGIERELADKPAGLRTHMLVAGAAALLVGISDPLLERFTLENGAYVRTDPIRIIEAVITGISFLGAGTILRRHKNTEVEGLTTAASLLFVAAIGICVGLSQLTLALGATILAIMTLSGVKALEQFLRRD